MNLEENHKKDELLETLWHLAEYHDLTLSYLKKHDPAQEHEKALYQFASNGILIFDGEKITLTPKGNDMAKGIVRRHRLAERLMVDVLGKGVSETEKAACEFEHVLAPELVESICILLGHPKKCPHGSPIPEGRCCVEAQSSIESAAIPLTRMKIGSAAKIISINTRDDSRMHKLLAMGLTPGVEIRLHQTYPAIVVEVDQRQIAMEESIGEEIHVWKPVEK
ncbi:MAG: metal-dependent transcriptional regulator [Nitrospinae bacterium]|nr:metal-dependent transcriptional regulator [Nitrospinota bacterium]